MPRFTAQIVDYHAAALALHAVRTAVFVNEQGVPPALERDRADPHCIHVLARDAAGAPIGAVRLMPPVIADDMPAAASISAKKPTPGSPPRVGRMAVLPEWRGHGVGETMLAELSAHATTRAWPELHLHAQTAAIGFYMRQGFVPHGPVFHEAGIAHQSMHLRLRGPVAIQTRDAAIAVTAALAHQARRKLLIRTQALDPGLLDAAHVLDALRRFAVRGGGSEIRILMHEASAAARVPPLVVLAQRLPSVLQLRLVEDPADRIDSSACTVSDRGWFERIHGQLPQGEAELDAPVRARQLAIVFGRLWERARPCTELRALGL